ncbi:hypothetical protein [Streptomyces californicus]|uniref:hypothetical protein n=1 Tax=Streptomyces californicus TaxID=67351 RepID=UPI0037A3C477
MSTVTIPGALADHLAAQYIADDETAAALDAARRGRGRTLVIEPTSTRVLHIISRHAEHILSIPRAYNRAARDAARLWLDRAGHAPAVMTHTYDSTEDAYNRTQCGDDIRDGDVLIIEREGVVGFLRSAWPAAITVARGELHGIEGDPRTLDDGLYVPSIEAAEKIAREHGFALAAEQRLDAVEVEVAEQFATVARAVDAVEHAEQVEAGVATVEDAEALYAAQLVTEADATLGTWQGSWIGEQPADGLFDLAPAAEQGALFDDRAAVEVEVEVERVEFVAPEVTRASVDAYLARTYPALFAPEQPQPLALPPARLWAVEHMVVIRGEWAGLAMCGMSLKEANDRAGVLRSTGSKAVEVVPCSHGPKAHPDEYAANRCQGCGYRIGRGQDWHDGCRPRRRPAPGDLTRRAAALAAILDHAPAAPAAALDGEPPF